MAKIVVGFVECGFVPGEWNGPIKTARQAAINSACDYVMQTLFHDSVEYEVITQYSAIEIDWVNWNVIIPIDWVNCNVAIPIEAEVSAMVCN